MRLIISLLIVLIIFTITIVPTTSATTIEVTVRTEEELLSAIDSRTPDIIIDGLIPLNDEIIVEHFVTIRGQGALTVAYNHRHFIIQENGHLVINGDITLTRATDHSGNGGGVHVAQDGIFTLYSGHIYSNYMRIGGGVRVDSGHVYINGGTINHNHAVFGGGVSVDSGHIYINGGTISHNHAERGGGIEVRRGTLYINDGNIKYNYATHGGGISVDFGQLYLYDGSISHNNADLGGGIYIGMRRGTDISATMTMRGGEITENTAVFSGGGIHSYMSFVNLEQGTVQNNQATGHGGAYLSNMTIYHVGSEMLIDQNISANRHDASSQQLSLFEQLQTPSIIHIIALFALAGIALLITNMKKSKSNQ